MDVIQQIKSHFKLEAMVAPYTNGLAAPLQNKFGGVYLNGWCPFCQGGQPQRGKRPKFWVNRTWQVCNCFNPTCAAGRPMDAINFYARIWGISNQDAIMDLNLMMNNVPVVRRSQNAA